MKSRLKKLIAKYEKRLREYELSQKDLPSRDQADSIDLCDIEHIETSIKLTKEFLRHLKELQND